MENDRMDGGVHQIYIPPNYKEGTSMFGFMIKPLRLVQALPFVLIIVLIVFVPLHSLSLTAKLVILVVTCIPIILVCIIGINGDSLFRFIMNSFRASRAKRTCLYNPRIKTEIKPLSEVPLEEQMAPRERILAFVEKLKKEKEVELEQIDLNDLYFEDDEGIVPKPVNYMTPKEKKNYLKSQQ